MVPPEVRAQLQEVIDAGRVRSRVLDVWRVRRAVGSGVGLTVLLSGRPGTGKTIATEIIASELERPLARIDGSKVVSKWVGETQKNLKTALEDAVLHGAVLFFDEADALFAKRVAKMESSNDRFANLETNYLLQALERHDGIVVLATNIETAIDDAFKRRLLYKVELPMPDAPARAQIWEGILRRSEEHKWDVRNAYASAKETPEKKSAVKATLAGFGIAIPKPDAGARIFQQLVEKLNIDAFIEACRTGKSGKTAECATDAAVPGIKEDAAKDAQQAFPEEEGKQQDKGKAMPVG